MANERHQGQSYGGASLWERACQHWPLLAVLLTFVASMGVVHTLAAVAISDDWVYIRSVEILVREHRLYVLPIATAHLVFQIVWAGLFASVFGPSFGVIRLSVAVLWLLSGIAFYGLVWELTGKRALSALGAFAYLFNPLAYVLAFTFMTDSPFTALLTMAAYTTVRGLRGPDATRWLLAGSTVAAAAVLVRQPGLLIPLGVVTALWLTGRLRVNLAGVWLGLQISALPFAAYVAYYFWLTRINGVPVTQTLMRDQLIEGGLGALSQHAAQMFIIEATYIGLFALPIVAAAAPALFALMRTLPGRCWTAVIVWETLILAGFAGLWQTGHVMPYVPHFFSRAGLGPNDLLIARSPVADPWFFSTLTLVCTAAALAMVPLLIRALDAVRSDAGPRAQRLAIGGEHGGGAGTAERGGGLDGGRDGVTVLLSLLAWQGVGGLLVSTHFRYWMIGGVSAPSLDRYLLPLLPLALAALVWAVRDLRLSLTAGWWFALLFGIVAVVGTRDNIVFHEVTWELARVANAEGVPNLKLDAGAAWDGYYVGEYSYERIGIGVVQDPRWWIGLFAPAIDSEYLITVEPPPGHTVVHQVSSRLWLDPEAQQYLVRRP